MFETMMSSLTVFAARSRVAARSYRRDIRGVAAVETAFILPVMLVMYFGLVDVTDLLSANRKVTQTTSTLADLVTQAPGTVKKKDLNGFFNAAKPIMDPYPISAIGLEFFGYEMKNKSVSLAWKYSTGPSCGGTPAGSAQMKQMMIDNNDLVLARVCYKYKPITGKVIGAGSFNVDDTIMLRPRLTATLRCTDC